MFGTLKPHRCQLESADSQAHQNFYCGLCKSLDVHFSPFHRALVNHDSVFVALVTDGLLENSATRSSCRCPMNPLLSKDTAAASETAMKFATAVQILLAESWLADRAIEGSSLAGATRRLFSASFKKAHRMLDSLGVSLEPLQHFEKWQHAVETHADPTPESAAEPTARALGYIMTQIAKLPGAPKQLKTEKNQSDLHEFGRALGRVIYYTDALEDVEKDQKKAQFNPCLDSDESGRPKLSTARFQSCLAELQHNLHALPNLIQQLPWLRHQSLIENILLKQVQIQSRDAAHKAHRWFCGGEISPVLNKGEFELVEDAFDKIKDEKDEPEDEKKKKKRPEDGDDGDYDDGDYGGRRWNKKKCDAGCNGCDCCEDCSLCGCDINLCSGGEGCVSFECCECSACECQICELCCCCGD
ncbi:MAG: DUF5685 family protein [Planctomycetota bacterium]|nr:DUF5685 family protein [Planctomycetota bacterium]